jgi:hypothetical protein
MILKEHAFFIEARGIEMRVVCPLEAFEAADGLINASIH